MKTTLKLGAFAVITACGLIAYQNCSDVNLAHYEGLSCVDPDLAISETTISGTNMYEFTLSEREPSGGLIPYPNTTIHWYVNDSLIAVGPSLEHTAPANCGESYQVKAMVESCGEVDELVKTVNASDCVPPTPPPPPPTPPEEPIVCPSLPEGYNLRTTTFNAPVRMEHGNHKMSSNHHIVSWRNKLYGDFRYNSVPTPYMRLDNSIAGFGTDFDTTPVKIGIAFNRIPSQNPPTHPISIKEIRAWKFRPPAGKSGKFNPSNNLSEMAISISECPGNFLNLPKGCVEQMLTGQLSWTTRDDQPSHYCKLDPNKDYYLNMGTLNGRIAKHENRVEDLCVSDRWFSCGHVIHHNIE